MPNFEESILFEADKIESIENQVKKLINFLKHFIYKK